MFATTIHNNNQRTETTTHPFLNNNGSAQTMTVSCGVSNIIYDDGRLVSATPTTARSRAEVSYNNEIYSVSTSSLAPLRFLPSTGGTLTIRTHKNYLPSNFDIVTSVDDIGLIYADLTNLNGLHILGSGRGIGLQNNDIITTVILPESETIFNSTLSTSLFNFSGCISLTDIDMSGFHGIGGYIQAFTCASLSGLTLPTYIVAGVKPIQRFYFYGCALVGPLDLSVLTNLGGDIRLHNNPLIGSIIFPYTTNRISNINLSNCGVGYVDLKPLSGYTYSVGSSITIAANTNNISKANMNHLLVDLDGLGWSGGTLTANSGNNGYDNSGGYDGITAYNSLTGATKGWTISL